MGVIRISISKFHLNHLMLVMEKQGYIKLVNTHSLIRKSFAQLNHPHQFDSSKNILTLFADNIL